MSAYTHYGDCSIKDPCLRCKEFGATQERERIIALLEEHIETAKANGLDCPRWAIALIKGEQK